VAIPSSPAVTSDARTDSIRVLLIHSADCDEDEA
jgi:hypothetical protein